MARKKELPLAFGFTSGDSSTIYPRKSECLFCDGKFPTPPIIIVMSELKTDGNVEGNNGCYICPSCILSDTATLTAKARATAAKHRRKLERLRKEAGPGHEDAEDWDLDPSWCDNSDWLNDFLAHLTRLGDVSKIINYDLAVHIARHYTENAKGRAA